MMVTTITHPLFRAGAGERRNFAVRPRLTVDEWSRKHLKIVDGPLVAGAPAAWNPETFPPQVTVMRACLDPRWAKVVIMGPPQAFGKTVCAAIAPCLFTLEHRLMSAAYVAANAALARTQWNEKFSPAIAADERLRSMIELDRMIAGDHSQRRFANGTTLHMTGAESIGNLSGYTVAALVCDDAHAYPASVPNYGHPGDYAESRLEAYPAEQRVHVIIGTASTRDAWLCRTLLGSSRHCLFVPCLGCGTYQLLLWERLVYDEHDPAAARGDTWHRCAGEGCDHHMTFAELPEMLRGHAWISQPEDAPWITMPQESGVTADLTKSAVYPASAGQANSAGFWANAFYWPHGKTWGERAADFLELRGQPDKELTFQQNVLVRPFAPPAEDADRLEVKDLETHASDFYHWRTVPAEADLVTLSIDVHHKFLYYIVEGWRKRDGENYLVGKSVV